MAHMENYADGCVKDVLPFSLKAEYQRGLVGLLSYQEKSETSDLLLEDMMFSRC